jgi:serine/threonine protein kinase/tetratricopeptide (TPR) repeat protein
MPMICSACGAETTVELDRCPSCGTDSEDLLRTGLSTVTQPPLSITRWPTSASSGPKPIDRDDYGPLAVGASFGPRYRVEKLLGMGGMGAVYEAWDQELDMPVALKVIRPDQFDGSTAGASSSHDRFKRELVLARQVTHKNVIRIHDLGEVEGTKYLTMAYVEGTDLARLLDRNGKLEIAPALGIARQIAAGLAAAHEAGVVHRDLKPANILIQGDTALITDFGIARSAEGSATDTGSGVVGTLQYMAPEQARGRPVDHRVDIYACGLILYEMLSGQRFIGRTTGRKRLMTDDPIEAPDINLDDVPEAVARIIARCLQPQPENRFQSAAALLDALNDLDASGNPLPRMTRIEIPKSWPMLGGLSLSRNTAAAVLALILAVPVSSVALFVARGSAVATVEQHEPVSVVIADLQNLTDDPTLDRTLEPMLKLALEDAGFISAYDRSRISPSLGVEPPEKLDERAALELAIKQGLGVVVSGSLNRQGRGYTIAINAREAVTGNLIITAEEPASDKNKIMTAVAEIATAVRRALGDDRPDSVQRFATQTFSATSLDVVRQYAVAAEALSSSRFDDAFESFSKAAAMDPNFGLAYAGMGIASRNLDKQQDAERYMREALRHLDSMTERERYRTRGLVYFITNDSHKCVEEYTELIARYAADAAARNNLATCFTYLRQMPKAMAEMYEALKILPNRALYWQNLALYAAYSGDSKSAEAAALKNPGVFGLIARAFSQVLQGRLTEAAETYQTLGKIDEQGASYMASGLGDLALYRGHFSDAARIFSEGAAADLASNDPDRAANKLAALAYTELLRQQKRAAITAAEKALANSTAVKIRFLAARVFVEAGSIARAKQLAASLSAELLAEPQAYGKIIEGEITLKNGDPRQAIKHLTEAGTLLDTWIGHFDLARAYLEAGAFTQADSELDRCITRRGEALSLFLDEEPTYGYFPPVYYYQGRVREGLNNAGFAESYRVYLNIRGDSKEDPLLAEVHRRTGRQSSRLRLGSPPKHVG